MALICGDNGSTASEVIEQINLNTDELVAHDGRLVVLENKIVPRGSLRLATVGTTQTITDAVEPALLIGLDTIVTERGDVDVDPVAYSITYTGPAADTAIITIGLNVAFPGTEELEVYLFINDIMYSDTPVALQGGNVDKPEIVFWQSDISLNTGDVMTVRGRNADAGSFDLTYLRTTFRVDVN